MAALWFTLLLFAAGVVASTLLKPRPRVENARPAGLGDFQFPTATEGRPIPLVWGTVLVKGPNVVWHGDLQQEAVTDRVKTGLFSSKRVVTGFRYRLGVQMAVCRGRDDGPVGGDVQFLRVFIGENLFANSDGSNPLGSGVSEGSVSFDNEGFLGGEDEGRGGIVGTVTFRPGSRGQSIPSYLSTHQQLEGTNTPRYTGTAYVLLERVLLGTSTQIDPWWFEVRRMPDPLSLGANNTVNSGNDLNPVSAIVELLTNDEWGFGQALSTINTSAFSAAGLTLFNENNGFSYVLDRTIDAVDLLRNIERQIDGVVFQNRSTGLWDIKLTRPTDTPVLALDSTNVLDVRSFTRASFQDTSNEVVTAFQHRQRDYEDSYGRAQDLGNITQRGGEVVSETINYTGVKDPVLAQQLADRDLLTFSYPLARARLVVNRDAWDVNPSDIVTWTNSSLGLSAKQFRVTRFDLGTMLDGQIVLDLVENVFALGDPSFVNPGGGSWVPPATVLEAYAADSPSQALIFEAPRAFVERDPDFPGVHPRLWFGARNKGDGAIVYDLETAAAVVQGSAAAFFVQGRLSDALPRHGGETPTFEIVADASTLAEIDAQLNNVQDGDVGQQLSQLVLIGTEFVGVAGATNIGSSVRVDTGYRGFLDTVPEAHAKDAPVWLVFVGGSLTDGEAVFGTSRVITQGLNQVRLAPGDAFSTSVTASNRFELPYPPARLQINSADYPEDVNWDSAVSGVPFDGRGIRLDYVRRDFRLADEVAKHKDESALPTDFPGANSTEYQFVFTPSTGTATTIAWASAVAGPTAISRAELVWNADANPANFDLSLDVRHVVDGATRQGRSVLASFNLAGTTPPRNYLGRMDNGVVRSFVAPEDGTYAFDIGADLLNGGVVEAQVNGGGYSTVIAASGSSGTLPGVTVSDAIDVRHTGVDGDAVFALLLVTPPTATGYVAPLRI